MFAAKVLNMTNHFEKSNQVFFHIYDHMLEQDQDRIFWIGLAVEELILV